MLKDKILMHSIKILSKLIALTLKTNKSNKIPSIIFSKTKVPTLCD